MYYVISQGVNFITVGTVPGGGGISFPTSGTGVHTIHVAQSTPGVMSNLLGSPVPTSILAQSTFYGMVTFSVATPTTVTWTGNGLSNGQIVVFTTTGNLANGVLVGHPYYVVNVTTNTFQIALTPNGSPVGASSTGTGNHSAYVGPYLTPMRILGYIDWSAGLPTPGFWSAPTWVQPKDNGTSLPGTVIQYVFYANGQVATGTGTYSAVDTIPTTANGTQFLAQAITPNAAANVLVVHSEINATNNAGGSNVQVLALHQDAIANALAVGWMNVVSASGAFFVTVDYACVANLVSPTTFKVRSGASGASTTTVNGAAGFRYFGGVLDSRIEIEEIQA
jgi:hypothetical protein